MCCNSVLPDKQDAGCFPKTEYPLVVSCPTSGSRPQVCTPYILWNQGGGSGGCLQHFSSRELYLGGREKWWWHCRGRVAVAMAAATAVWDGLKVACVPRKAQVSPCSTMLLSPALGPSQCHSVFHAHLTAVICSVALSHALYLFMGPLHPFNPQIHSIVNPTKAEH